MEKSILVVDDNEEIIDIVKYNLIKNGYLVFTSTNAKDALDILKGNSISLTILDVMMPGEDGFSLCKKIREFSNIPILFLTAKSCEDDKVNGLLCGGDDYMIKPFSAKELIARVMALLRRCEINENLKKDKEKIKINNLCIHKDSNCVRLKDSLVNLTDIEYRILIYLVERRGESISTKEIFENIWGELFISTSNNTVVVHIKNMRRKFESIDSDFEYIHTVWGRGYAVY